MPHTEGRSIGIANAAALVISQPWGWLLIGGVVVRILFLLLERKLFDPLWDGLLLSAVAYTCANILLQFGQSYYFAPAAFAAWLCGFRLARVANTVWDLNFAVPLALIALFQVPSVWQDFTKRKELIYSKADAARFIADAAVVLGKGSDADPVVLYPVTSAEDNYDIGLRVWEIGIFAGYLEAKYDIEVIVALPAGDGQFLEPQPCINRETAICQTDISASDVDVAIAFNEGGEPPPHFALAYASVPVGFWINRRRAFVFLKESDAK